MQNLAHTNAPDQTTSSKWFKIRPNIVSLKLKELEIISGTRVVARKQTQPQTADKTAEERKAKEDEWSRTLIRHEHCEKEGDSDE